MRVDDALVVEQPGAALDRPKRALGVVRDAREHPLALGLLPPATVRLVVRPPVIELQPVIERPAGPFVDSGDGVEQAP